MKRRTNIAIAALASLAVAGCGGSNDPNADAAKAFRNALDPLSAQLDQSSDLSVSCARNQGTEFTCTLSGDGGMAMQSTQGPGVYSVTYDPNSKYIYYTKVES